MGAAGLALPPPPAPPPLSFHSNNTQICGFSHLDVQFELVLQLLHQLPDQPLGLLSEAVHLVWTGVPVSVHVLPARVQSRKSPLLKKKRKKKKDLS